jgi:hypothetical protein
MEELNTELKERVQVLLNEKAAMQLGLEELQRKLEIFELLQLPFSNHSEPPDANKQLQQALKKWAELER